MRNVTLLPQSTHLYFLQAAANATSASNTSTNAATPGSGGGAGNGGGSGNPGAGFMLPTLVNNMPGVFAPVMQVCDCSLCLKKQL
jgi:hypothetical protein